ncbi:hypothetical protein [Leptospira bouyouniensis]|uniref:hypothetical protein n=1 Tax=Leptospira bouyouniensis TaxID=2484911 RepID=UPI001090FF65|nr:hypothetical protein [Leptospira bouyouniensis]TGM88288.1 hypothetical protein EHQ99_00285 [Leptospira bouyouniensis]
MINRILEIYRGDTYRGDRGLIFEDIPNLHLPSTTVQFSVKKNPEDEERVISFPINGSDPGNDWSEPVRRIVVNLETGHTQLLEGGIYFYDIEINYSGEIITAASGEFIIVPDIAKTVHVVSPTTEASIYSNLASTLATLGASLVGVVALFWDSITGSPSGTVESILRFLWNNKVNRIPTPIGSRLIKSSTDGTYIQETQVSITNEGDVSGIRDLTLERDLFVPGKIVSQGNLIEGDVIQVKDKNIEIGKVETPTDDTADGGGITLLGDTNKTINWVKSKLAWLFSDSIELLPGKQFLINGVEYVFSRLSLLSGSEIAGRILTSTGSGFSFQPPPSAPVTSVNSKTGAVDLSDEYYSKTEIDTRLSDFAELDGSGKIPSSVLPSYVDDVLEFADLASLPISGESGKIYITLDNGKQYRWSGSSYVEIVSSPGTTDNVSEGTTNKYFTESRVLSTPLSGFVSGPNAPIEASDSLIQGIQKLQSQVSGLGNPFDLHDFKFSGKNLIVSPTVPWLRADVDHSSLSASNFPDFVPYLLDFSYTPNDTFSSDIWAAVNNTPITNPILELWNDSTNAQVIRDLLNDLRFNAWDESINDFRTLDATRFSEWGMVLEIVTSGVPGITAGTKRVITYGSSLSQSLDPATLRIRIDGTATGNGALTFRIKPFARISDSNARWRKIDDAVLQSGFNGLRRLDQGQGHRHSFSSGAAMVPWGGDTGQGATSYFGPHWWLNNTGIGGSVLDATTDGSNGAIRIGNKFRPRAGGAKLYVFCGRYFT